MDRDFCSRLARTLEVLEPYLALELAEGEIAGRRALEVLLLPCLLDQRRESAVRETAVRRARGCILLRDCGDVRFLLGIFRGPDGRGPPDFGTLCERVHFSFLCKNRIGCPGRLVAELEVVSFLCKSRIGCPGRLVAELEGGGGIHFGGLPLPTLKMKPEEGLPRAT